MKRTLHILTLMIVVASNGLAQTNKMDALYAKFLRASDTNTAAAEIVEVARNDQSAKTYLSSKLPALIIDQLPTGGPETASPVWLNAVRLTGQLKLVAAIPALKQALSKPSMFFGAYDDTSHGASTFTSNAKLGSDLVGRALADIGDPSVPVVAEFLSTGDSTAKKRAMWILLNIDSPEAKKAMADDLRGESDPMIKAWIQEALNGHDYKLK